MKRMKGILIVSILVLLLTVFSPVILPFTSHTAVAQTTSVKLNKKSLTLNEGESETLKVTGTKEKVTWKSSETAVASVNKQGKVSAKKEGIAIITASVNNKKYMCKVTVINPYTANAPFDAAQMEIGTYKTVLPANWTYNVTIEETGYFQIFFYPPSARQGEISSNLCLTILDMGKNKIDYDTMKEELCNNMFTKEAIVASHAQAGITSVVTDLKAEDYQAKSGKYYRAEYGYTYSAKRQESTETEAEVIEGNAKQIVYATMFDNYFFYLVGTDMLENTSPDFTEVLDYFIDTIRYTSK